MSVVTVIYVLIGIISFLFFDNAYRKVKIKDPDRFKEYPNAEFVYVNYSVVILIAVLLLWPLFLLMRFMPPIERK